MYGHRLGNRIRAFRKLKGYTQQELAQLIGISISIMGAIERGMKEPSEKMIKQIAEVLAVEVAELLGNERKGSI
jgi:transcriptional regulator with XRE-family HTH domain